MSKPPSPSPSSTNRKARVLVIDDEPSMGGMVVDGLAATRRRA
jgi:hypothetical protein